MALKWMTTKTACLTASISMVLGLALMSSLASGNAQVAAPATSQALILGALKTQGMSPIFQSGYVEMLHGRRDLMANEQQPQLRVEFQKEVERRLEHAKTRGASAAGLAKLRQELEREADQNTEEIVNQQTRKVTYERCLFIGNGSPIRHPDNKTRIDRTDVKSLDVPLSSIPKTQLGTVVNEAMGTPQSVCAGYGYGPGAKEVYLQQSEYFPRPQDFGRIYGAWAVALSTQLMDDPNTLTFTFSGKKAMEWLAQPAVANVDESFRIIGHEIRGSSQVYIVEVASRGKLLSKVWIDPSKGFAVPRIELYEARGKARLSSSANPSEIMECSDFIHLNNPDVWFPLLTKYTKFGMDGKPETVDIYKVFSPKQVAFNLELADDAFKISFKRGMRLEDTRPNRPKGNQYYGDGIKEDINVLPSELAALVDKQDPKIGGDGKNGANVGIWTISALGFCGVVLSTVIVLIRKERYKARKQGAQRAKLRKQNRR